MLGAVPIYYASNDKRVLAYLQKNITAHVLKTGSTKVKWSDLARKPEYTAGQLNLRHSIKTKASFWDRVWGRK